MHRISIKCIQTLILLNNHINIITVIYGLIIHVCKGEDHFFRISILISEKI